MILRLLRDQLLYPTNQKGKCILMQIVMRLMCLVAELSFNVKMCVIDLHRVHCAMAHQMQVVLEPLPVDVNFFGVENFIALDAVFKKAAYTCISPVFCHIVRAHSPHLPK